MGVYTLMAYWINEVPYHLKTQEICNEVVSIYPFLLKHVPDHLKIKKLCNEAIQKRPCLLEYVPDWFVTQGQIKFWHDDSYYCNDDYLIKWYDGYQRRKAQKAQIK